GREELVWNSNSAALLAPPAFDQVVTKDSPGQLVFSEQLLDKKNAFEFSSFDIALLKLLADGVRQKDIPAYLQEQNIRPAGLSSVEKRLSLLREEHAFATNEQLIGFCKELGII
ncbi:MAG: hypothetical protein MUE38_06330, partial [Flavihumibacter sp.]|nr:hypothetical protein [Flavihumibacter sp.]